MRRMFLLLQAAMCAAIVLASCGQQGAGPATATVVALPPATTLPPPPAATAPPATAASPSPTPKPTATQAKEMAAIAGKPGPEPSPTSPLTPAPAKATPIVPQDLRTGFFLELESPASLDVVVKVSPIVIQGRTLVDALVTVNDYVLEPNIEGRFRQAVALTPGLNIIEIAASAASGEQEALVVGVGYIAE